MGSKKKISLLKLDTVSLLAIIMIACILATLLGLHAGFPYAILTAFLMVALLSAVACLFILAKGAAKPPRGAETKPSTPTAMLPLIKGEEGAYAVEIYEIKPPLASAIILKKFDRFEYHVIEPKLSADEEALRRKIELLLYEELKLDSMRMSNRAEAERCLANAVSTVVKRYRIPISKDSFEKILYYFVRDHVGYGKIDPLMFDENIEDISCNGPDMPVYVYHKFYESIPTNIVFTKDELEKFVVRLAYMAGKHVTISAPIVDGRLPDGSRLNVTYKDEVSRKGTTFTIRKFREKPYTIVDLMYLRTLDEEIGAFLWYVVENMCSVLVAGGTAAGKTTLLNALSLFIRPEKKIVSIEDTAELQLYHQNWIPLVERTGFGVRGGGAEIRLFELLKTSLRQRPDVIIVGEVRGEEAYTMFQAMATGHGGLGSIHAESVEATINRLKSEPMNVPDILLSTLDVITLIMRVKVGEKMYRKIIEVAEPYYDEEEGRIKINKLFRWNPINDSYIKVGESRTLKKISERTGVPLSRINEEIEARKNILRWMYLKKIRKFEDFVDIINRFYMNPSEVKNVAMYELLRMEAL